MGERQFEQYPQQRQPPDNRHQPFGQRRVEPHQQKRRVGTGNQEINGAMVKLLQPVLGFLMRNGMVQG
ncbi:hypothetical protein D3C77_757820 [compost metagenome]